MRHLILIAAHDDGSGAHVTLFHLCRALLERFRTHDNPPLLVYLNSSNFQKEWAKRLWFEMSERPDQWRLQEPDAPWPDDDTLAGLDGVWVNCDHGIRLGKLPDGKLDVAGTRQLLATLHDDFRHWGYQVRHLPAERVQLAVDMGVPQLCAWAHENSTSAHTIRAVSVGDMFWSRTLGRSLEGAGEYDETIEKIISYVQRCETMTSEVWTLPLVAALDYVKLFRGHRIPFNQLPGFFGPREPTEAETAEARANLGTLESDKLVVVSSGSTPVWNAIYDDLAAVVEKRAGTRFALLIPATDRRGLQLVDKGTRRAVPDMNRMLAYFRAADFGITRGGITTTEFIASRIPFIVVQEPDHWLSRRQQSQVRNAGLCHSACLTRIQNPESAFELIAEKLDSPLNPAMVARMGMIPFGVEEALADYLSTFSPPCLAPSSTSITNDTKPHLVSHPYQVIRNPTLSRTLSRT